jgi:hypothetical protein
MTVIQDMAVLHEDSSMRHKFLASAEVCEWVRVYAMVFLEPGISASARTAALIWLQDSWMEKYDVMKFPPGSDYGQQYPLHVWSHTLSAIVSNIFLRLVFPSITEAGAVNSRSIATSQPNERCFAVLSKYSESQNGTPPSIKIEDMLSRLLQKKILDIEVNKCYSFRSSAKSKTVYDFNYQDRQSQKVTQLLQEKIY